MNKQKSYSQVGQDLFVLSMFPKGYKGIFLDIGCKWPEIINNTKLLEENGWNGISIDIDDYSEDWKTRKSKYIQANAFTLDYSTIELPKGIDYLSLDINTYAGARFHMLKILVRYFEFKVITIEHELYLGYFDQEVKPQRELLRSLDYTLKVKNVENEEMPFEDWWINEKYINGI
jgi:hypothetical protein